MVYQAKWRKMPCTLPVVLTVQIDYLSDLWKILIQILILNCLAVITCSSCHLFQTYHSVQGDLLSGLLWLWLWGTLCSTEQSKLRILYLRPIDRYVRPNLGWQKTIVDHTKRIAYNILLFFRKTLSLLNINSDKRLI